MLVLFLGFLQLIGVCADVGTGLFIARVQRYAVFDVDMIMICILFCHFNIIADLALEANVRHKAIAGFGVDARHIARIGITVRIAVFHVEQHHKFITVLDGIRHFLLLFAITLMIVTKIKTDCFFLRESRRWWCGQSRSKITFQVSELFP